MYFEKENTRSFTFSLSLNEAKELLYSSKHKQHEHLNHNISKAKLKISFADSVGRGGRIQIVPDFDLVDSEDQTALELALWTGQYQVAERLLEAGASISGLADSGFSLLHKAVKRGDSDSALFLLEHGADINTR